MTDYLTRRVTHQIGRKHEVGALGVGADDTLADDVVDVLAPALDSRGLP